MRHIAGYLLWIGHSGDVRNVPALFDAGIEAIVELADNEPFVTLPREFIRCRFPISDSGDNPVWLLQLAAETLASLLKNKVPVLVCCSAGMNRSIGVAASGLAIAEGVCLTEALSFVVRSGPADLSPALFEKLMKLM